MYLWLILIIFNLQNCYMVAVMCMCLRKRFEKASVWAYIAVFEALTFIPSYIRYTKDMYTTEYMVVYYLMQITMILFLVIGFRDSVWKKVLWLIAYLCVATLCELFAGGLLTVFFGIELQGTWDGSVDLIYMVWANLVLFVCTIIPIIWWKRRKISIGDHARLFVPMILLALSQSAMLNYLLDARNRYDVELPKESYGIFSLCVIADAVFLLLLVRQQEIHEVNKKVQELEDAWELEKAYYAELEKKEEALSVVRHDLKNQLAVMYKLVEMGDVKRVKEMKEELVKQL